MLYHFNRLFLLSALLFVFGCIDPVDINLKEGQIQIAVDGSITDQSLLTSTVVADTVRITMTNGFSDGPSTVVNNALLILHDNFGNSDTLTYYKNGKYLTHPSKITGVLGRMYELIIFVNGETYKANDVIKRVTRIDSLLTDYRTEPQFGRAPGYFINLFATDLKGPGDFYRFKVYKNGELFNRPLDLNFAADAGFGKNDPIDNLRFIFPIREGLNPATGENDPATQGDKAPYVPGDTVRVEILSITEATFDFLNEVRTQISNDGLFAGPAVNVSTNVININPQGKKAVGWFNASAIVSKQLIIKKE